jgi:hypothetical protein
MGTPIYMVRLPSFEGGLKAKIERKFPPRRRRFPVPLFCSPTSSLEAFLNMVGLPFIGYTREFKSAIRCHTPSVLPMLKPAQAAQRQGCFARQGKDSLLE